MLHNWIEMRAYMLQRQNELLRDAENARRAAAARSSDIRCLERQQNDARLDKRNTSRHGDCERTSEEPGFLHRDSRAAAGQEDG